MADEKKENACLDQRWWMSRLKRKNSKKMADEGRATSTGSPSCGIKETIEGSDLISCLPDVILQSILSSLPTRFAIRTSVLSKRWRHVWSDTPSLTFHSKRPNAASINETLDRYRAPKMMSFQICTSRFDKHDPYYMDSWINFAMSRNVENLSLDFGDGAGDYKIPEFLYINSSVKQLRIELGYKNIMSPKCLVSWTSLKYLSLIGCILSDESIANILPGCPVLESLSLICCNELRVLDLSKSPRLKTLEIKRNTWVPAGPTQIVAPHIRCLTLTNSQSVPCTLVDVSSLSEAKLDIGFYASVGTKLEADFLQTMVVKMLDKCQYVEKLTLGENFLKILSLAELRSHYFPKFKAKALTLETMISRYVIPGIVRVLQNSPHLKKLTIHLMGPAGVRSIPEADIDKYLDPHGLNSDQCWSSEARVFNNIFRKKVESKHVASFIELVLKTTKSLEMMVARLEGYLKGTSFEELCRMVPMLTDNNHVSIVLSSTKNGSMLIK